MLGQAAAKLRDEVGAMRISGHKTRSVFDRYNIIDESDLKLAVRKLQKFQDAAEPAGPVGVLNNGRSSRVRQLTTVSF